MSELQDAEQALADAVNRFAGNGPQSDLAIAQATISYALVKELAHLSALLERPETKRRFLRAKGRK